MEEPDSGSAEEDFGDADLPRAADDDESQEARKDTKRLRKSEKKEQKRLFSKEQRTEKKRAQRKRKSEARQSLLNAMSTEEREAFIENERAAGRIRKAAWDETLDYAYKFGRPRVVINCNFGDSMDVRELTSLAKQVSLAYTHVRNLSSKVQLHVTSLKASNAAARSFEAAGSKSWKIHLHEESVWEVFTSEVTSGQLVVLTPDADEDLDEVREDEVYVIGGIVDRSVHKLQSYNEACERGAKKLRRLPLKKFGPKGCCPVLNIDCVVRMLCEWLRRGGDWPGVFEECLPGRRLGDRPAQSKRSRRAERRLAREQAEEAGAEEAHEASESDKEDLISEAE